MSTYFYVFKYSDIFNVYFPNMMFKLKNLTIVRLASKCFLILQKIILFLNIKGMFAIKKYNLININRKGRSIKPVFTKIFLNSLHQVDCFDHWYFTGSFLNNQKM